MMNVVAVRGRWAIAIYYSEQHRRHRRPKITDYRPYNPWVEQR